VSDQLGLWAWKGSNASEMCLILSEPGCWIAQISDEQWSASGEDEVETHFHGVFHCLWVWKGRTDVSDLVCGVGRGPRPQTCLIFSEPGCWIAQIPDFR